MKPLVLRAEDIKGSVIKGDLANLDGGSNGGMGSYFVFGIFFVLSSYFGYFSKYKCDANVLFRSNYAFHDS